MSSALETVQQLDNDAILIESENREAAREKWQTAKKVAEEQLLARPEPEWSYISGYLSYMLFSRGMGSFTETEKHLRDGLGCVSNCDLAQFYLGALHFESGKLGSALPLLESIYRAGKARFVKLGQEWRYVKSVEMLVAAYIREGAWFEARTMGTQLDALYRECENPESIVPLTLVGALEDVDSQEPDHEYLCKVTAGVVQWTRSDHTIRRLFPQFSKRWI